MWKKIKDSKWSYVVLSILMAIILWAYVVKEANPSIKRNISGIPVTFSGTDILAARNLIIAAGSEQTMTLNVEAKSDVMSKLSRDTISVTVDVSKILEPGDYRIMPDIGFSPNVPQTGIAVNNDVSDLYVGFTVSKLETKEVPVKLDFKGSIAKGYQAGEPVLTPGTISISGQRELVNQVAYAKVVLAQEELNASYAGDLTFIYVGSDGQELTGLKVTSNVDTVHVVYPIVMTKRVPVSVKIIPGGGATEKDVKVTFGSDHESEFYLDIAGPEADIEAYKEIALGEINLSDVVTKETYTFPVKLSDTFTNESGITEVSVTVEIDDTRLSTAEFEVDNIQLINVPAGFQASLVTQSRQVTVRGARDAIAALFQSQVRIIVDLSAAQKAAGRQTVPAKVMIDGSNEVGVLGSYNVVVSLTQ